MEQSPKRKTVLNKIASLCKDHDSWKNEDDILQLFGKYFKGDRFFTRGIITLHNFKRLFDSELNVVKEHLLNKYSNYYDGDATHIWVKENLILIQKDIGSIHFNFDVGYPTTDWTVITLIMLVS